MEKCAADCREELSKTIKVIVVCPLLHKMHAECVNKMFEHMENPTCPICRDDTLSLLKDMILKNPEPKSDSSEEEEGSGEEWGGGTDVPTTGNIFYGPNTVTINITPMRQAPP